MVRRLPQPKAAEPAPDPAQVNLLAQAPLVIPYEDIDIWSPTLRYCLDLAAEDPRVAQARATCWSGQSGQRPILPVKPHSLLVEEALRKNALLKSA